MFSYWGYTFYLKSITFGVEVTQSTSYAFGIDKVDGTSLQREAMEVMINQFYKNTTLPQF